PAPGALWALVEAARAVDDKALGWRALARAAASPPGCAADGLTQLRLWLAYRDPRTGARVRECVDELVRSGATGPDAGLLLLGAGRLLGVRAALRAADAAALALHASDESLAPAAPPPRGAAAPAGGPPAPAPPPPRPPPRAAARAPPRGRPATPPPGSK